MCLPLLSSADLVALDRSAERVSAGVFDDFCIAVGRFVEPGTRWRSRWPCAGDDHHHLGPWSHPADCQSSRELFHFDGRVDRWSGPQHTFGERAGAGNNWRANHFYSIHTNRPVRGSGSRFEAFLTRHWGQQSDRHTQRQPDPEDRSDQCANTGRGLSRNFEHSSTGFVRKWLMVEQNTTLDFATARLGMRQLQTVLFRNYKSG